jgi:hypothetical protein
MWRNFTQGNIGELSAQQWMEIQNSVAARAWMRRPLDQPLLQRERTLLVKIGPKFGTGTVIGSTTSQVPGATRIRAQAYEFTQVFMRLDNNGSVEEAERSYGLKSVIPGTFTDQRYYAIDINESSNISIGTHALITPVDIDMGPPGFAFDEKQFFYPNIFVIVSLIGPPMVRMMFVTATLDDAGLYTAVERDFRTGQQVGDPVTLYNVYEIDGNDYYGALKPENQNPCASLDPRPLQPGHWVIATNWADSWYTIAPTPFKAICQECGPGGTSPLTDPTSATEEMGAAIMLKGL